jgi:hypothetical protein
MDSLIPRNRTILSRRDVLAGLALAVLAPAGCLDKYMVKKEPAAPAPPPESKQRIVSVWDNKVHFADDSQHGGAPMPVLVGKIFLFGPEIDTVDSAKSPVMPFIGDGSLIIDLYDNTPHRGVETDPKMLEEFRIDPVTLKKFAKKDVFGDGYTIFFPWYTYRADISHVYIIMRYTFPDGTYVLHQSGMVSINHMEVQERLRKGMPVSNPAMRASNPQGLSATPNVAASAR